MNRIDSPRWHNLDPRDTNRDTLISAGLAFAFCLFLASGLPPALVPAMLHSLFFFVGLGSAFVAAWRAQPPFASTFTGWDVAAAFQAASIAAGWFIDPEAIRQAMQSAQ